MTTYLKKWRKWLEEHQKIIMSVSSVASTILVFFIGFQLLQSYSYKKYDNFLYFNQLYYDWYDKMPKAIRDNEKASFDSLDEAGKAWVRRYFNLYADEYYFYRHKMIPKEMWEDLIHGCKNKKPRAVFCNLKKYPALMQGYCIWKQNNGSFGFPEDFAEVFDNSLKNCEINVESVCNLD